VSDLYWPMDEQMARPEPYFPKSHGKPRVDDRRGVERDHLRQSQRAALGGAPKDNGPHKTLYNRWKRWGEMGVFARMMEGLAAFDDSRPQHQDVDAGIASAGRGIDWHGAGARSGIPGLDPGQPSRLELGDDAGCDLGIEALADIGHGSAPPKHRSRGRNGAGGRQERTGSPRRSRRAAPGRAATKWRS